MPEQKKTFRAPRLTEIGKVPTDPANARRLFGVRFHHFLADFDGRLVGTIVTIPDPDAPGKVLLSGSIAHAKDPATRAGGRLWAWRAMLDGRALSLSLVTAQDAIRNRYALQLILTDRLPRKITDRVSPLKLRPRAPATPEMLARIAARNGFDAVQRPAGDIDAGFLGDAEPNFAAVKG